jgi:hypothetical protein
MEASPYLHLNLIDSDIANSSCEHAFLACGPNKLPTCLANWHQTGGHLVTLWIKPANRFSAQYINPAYFPSQTRPSWKPFVSVSVNLSWLGVGTTQI